METTRLSTKGQFTVEETGNVILLRPAGRFPRADLDQVTGCLRSKRKSKTPAQGVYRHRTRRDSAS